MNTDPEAIRRAVEPLLRDMGLRIVSADCACSRAQPPEILPVALAGILVCAAAVAYYMVALCRTKREADLARSILADAPK